MDTASGALRGGCNWPSWVEHDQFMLSFAGGSVALVAMCATPRFPQIFSMTLGQMPFRRVSERIPALRPKSYFIETIYQPSKLLSRMRHLSSALALLLLAGCNTAIDESYESLQAAQQAGVLQHRWLPDIVPASHMASKSEATSNYRCSWANSSSLKRTLIDSLRAWSLTRENRWELTNT